VKRIAVTRAAITLLPPLAIICALFLGSASGGGIVPDAASPTATATPTPIGPTLKPTVQVGFVTTVAGVPPNNIQSIFLNIVAVRLNPLPKGGVGKLPSETNSKWVTIPVPPAISAHGGTQSGALQIDAIAGQSQAQMFNTTTVRVDTYQSVELLLDTNDPGSIVPTCSQVSPAQLVEGCASYPIQVQNPGQQLAFLSTVPVAKGKLTQLLINLDVTIVQQPTVAGGAYTIAIAPGPPVPPGSYLGQVTGTITGASGASKGKKIPALAVTAELEGTNTVIASSASGSSGKYTLSLPAAADFGTSYDVYVSGGGAAFAAARLASPVMPGQSIDQPFTTKTGQTLGQITGRITDACTKQPIVGATLQILVPQGTSTTDCATTPADCVSVASTSTDNTGSFPLPGTAATPAAFDAIPTNTDYTLQISAAGYDTLLTPTRATSPPHGGHCPESTSSPACDFALTTSYLVGTVSLVAAPPAGRSVTIQVFAEDHGTNTIENALPMPLNLKSPVTSANFTLNVPSSPSSRTFDVFASAIDLYQGQTDPYPGHTIGVISDVAIPTACSTPSGPQFSVPALECIGHGSITGSVINPDSGTEIELSKDDVQLMSAAPGPLPPAPNPGNGYTFCVPPDTYTLQRLEFGTPVGTPATSIPTAVPSSTSSPCPSICQNPDKTCPGLCSNTVQPEPL